MQKIRGIGIQEFRYKGIQGYRGIWVHEYRDTQKQEYRDTEHRDTEIQGYRVKAYRDTKGYKDYTIQSYILYFDLLKNNKIFTIRIHLLRWDSFNKLGVLIF